MRRMMQWLAPPLALMVLVGVVLFTVRNMKGDHLGPPQEIEGKPIYPDISVVTVAPDGYKAVVTGFGEASPHHTLTLVSEVSGRVEKIGAAFETGQILKKGELIVSLDDTEYAAAVATAESELAQSRLELLEEERQVAQARWEWDSSGLKGEPDSELVLRQPQLAVARANVKKGEAELKLSRKNLAKTIVTAPFDCLVVSREVAPGSYLQAGAEIASLYSIDKIEIAIGLSGAEWDNLPSASEIAGYQVEVAAVESGRSWQGRISRVEHHVDSKTRQRTVIVEVEDPLGLSAPLLPGTFVKVTIPGKSMDNLWKLPGSALSQRGEIWYVTKDNVLASFQAQPLFSDHDSIYVTAPDNLAGIAQRVLVHPLSSYLTGMKVNPVQEVLDGQS